MPREVIFCQSINGISIEHVKYWQASDSTVRHFHDEYEILFLIKGGRQVFLNGRAYLMQEGDVMLLDSGVIHLTRCPESGSPDYECMIFYITGKEMEELDERFPGLELRTYFQNHTGIFRLAKEQRLQFAGLGGLFRDECVGSGYGSRYIVEAAMVSSIVRMVRELHTWETAKPIGSGEAKYKRTYEMADYIFENTESVKSLDELAERFFVSKFYMCRAFKQVTGYTILEYLTILRIQKARNYLAQTDMSISRIAELVGYNSLTHFEKEFKRCLRVSPSRYRKNRVAAAYSVTADFPKSNQETYGILNKGQNEFK